MDDIIEKWRKVAKDYDLLVSGGTDYHNNKQGVEIGKFGVSKKEFEILKMAHKKKLNQ